MGCNGATTAQTRQAQRFEARRSLGVRREVSAQGPERCGAGPDAGGLPGPCREDGLPADGAERRGGPCASTGRVPANALGVVAGEPPQGCEQPDAAQGVPGAGGPWRSPLDSQLLRCVGWRCADRATQGVCGGSGKAFLKDGVCIPEQPLINWLCVDAISL